MHVVKVIHFQNNQNLPDRVNPDYDRLWKIRRIFDYLTYICIPHCTTPPKICQSNCKILGQNVFWAVHNTKRKRFGIKLYKPCDGKEYTSDIATYLVKQLLNAASNITTTEATVLKQKHGKC